MGGTLTDGTGISPITITKLVKDFIADFLLTGAAAFGAGPALEALDVGTVLAAPEAAGIAVATAFVKAAFRVVLRWSQS